MIERWKFRVEILKNLAAYSQNVKGSFCLVFFISIVEVVLALMIPIFYAIYIDKVILQGDYNLMLVVFGGYLFTQGISAFLGILKTLHRNKVANTVLCRVKKKILHNYLHMPFYEVNNFNAGNAKVILDEDIQKIDSFADVQTINYIISIGKLAVLLVLLLTINVKLSVILILIIPVTFFLDYRSSKISKRVNDEQRSNYEKWSTWLHEILSGWREMKALNLENYEQKQFKEFCGVNAKYFTQKTRWWVTRTMVIPKIKDEFVMRFFIYFLGGILIYMDNIAIGSLLVFVEYYAMFSETLQKISSIDAELIENTSYYNRIMKSMLVEQNEAENKYSQDPENVDIEFKNVTFSYDEKERRIIHNFNLKILSGERVGIVGESGKGKSTVLKLMVGMYKPQQGSIYFSNRNMNEWDISRVHKKIGFVMQENFLYNASIKENLLYGKPDATDNEIYLACKKAHIHEFVQSLNNGYDTVIGEKGIKLSGGQKQRIVLARLFLRDISVFIFDEATAALDQHSENLIQDALKCIDEDKTIIVVAHRKSSLELCERIISI